MSSQASTTHGSAPDQTAAANGAPGPGAVPGYGAVPPPQLVGRHPAPAAYPGRPPTWGQLRTPPQGAAYARPDEAMELPEPEVPLFGGGLGAKESPLRMRHLVGLCAWAAGLTLIGLLVGLWAMLRLMSYDTPGWFEPIIVLTGLSGIGLAIASFVTIDRKTTPWALMGGSTAVLILAIILTATAG
ncbi:MAG: hypothetical protein ACRDT4_05470 [Micromonosporaceae bacterium]